MKDISELKKDDIINVMEINWETDGESAENLGLPESTEVSVSELMENGLSDDELNDEFAVSESIGEWLSDTFGFLVNDFDFDF